MDKGDLLKELEAIIRSYIEDDGLIRELVENIEPTKVKYVLGALNRYKLRDYYPKDKELIKELFFYFC